ncbi:IGG2B protein, partial [Climacteris rufus]|nr:IGG2B protein [Climacteris rufus]
GLRLAPSVFVLPPPPEESSSSRPTLSLTCLVRGFSPDSIDVQWHRGNSQGDFGDNSAHFGSPVRE